MQMKWDVRGIEDTLKYVTFVVRAYPDLLWERTGPPLFADDQPRVAFCWRGTGTFSGRLDPPGIDGTDRRTTLHTEVRSATPRSVVRTSW
jgi:hypothetical protein